MTQSRLQLELRSEEVWEANRLESTAKDDPRCRLRSQGWGGVGPKWQNRLDSNWEHACVKGAWLLCNIEGQAIALSSISS